MEWQVIFPILTTTVSFMFFVSVTEQWFRKKKPHQLMWSISMFLFFITAGAEAFSLIFGSWNSWVYRAYYLFAAIQVSLMGAGLLYLFTRRNVIHRRNSAKAVIIFWSIWLLFSSLFLQYHPIFYTIYYSSILVLALAGIYILFDLKDRRSDKVLSICSSCKKVVEDECNECEWGKVIESYPSSRYNRTWQRVFQGDNFAHIFVLEVLIFFVMMNIFVWTLPLNTSMLRTGKEVSGLPWQDPNNPDGPRAVIRLFSPLHTVPGAIALIGGGVYSYVSWQRAIKRNTGAYQPSKGVYNLYIAIGAYVLGLGATLSGFGYGTLYISEIISVTFMYFGFLESDKVSKEVLNDFLAIFRIFKHNSTTELSSD